MTIGDMFKIAETEDEVERNRMIAKLSPADAKACLRFVLKKMHEMDESDID